MSVQKTNMLYIDCRNSGISGDMLLAALLKLIPKPEKIINQLINLKNYLKGVSKLDIILAKEKKNDLWVNQLQIALEETQHHRTAKGLRKALDNFVKDNEFGAEAGQYAKKVLDLLIKSESEVHGELEEKLHLHELSSVDTLIDILGTSLCLEKIGVFSKEFKVYCSELPVGGGKVKSAHGFIPVPAPVVVKILEHSQLKTLPGPIQAELSTPTGVALLAGLNPIVEQHPFTIQKMSQSMGQKEFDTFLNILRVYTGYSEEKSKIQNGEELMRYNEKITVLETNVDDVSGEIIGDFMEVINRKNILDVQVIQTLTKKNRPGYIIKVLCNPEHKFEIIETIINHLGTLGVRYKTVDRICIERELHQVSLKINEKQYSVHLKVSYYQIEGDKRIVNIKPEYDDLKKIRADTGQSIRELAHTLQQELIKKNKK
jgi:hypothetical protein